MPKKAVTLFFILALVGAALFVFLTFPRSKDQIPASNNQRPFPSAPGPANPSTPNGVPVPETVPHPNVPKVPPGPTLRVMAWAAGSEATTLEAQADAFGAATGRRASLTIESSLEAYRRDLQQALANGIPPDVVFISTRDFCGLDPARDLAEVKPVDGAAPRSIMACTVDGAVRAVPAEFSVDVLFYNIAHFDQAGLGYPDRHWNWDILEADARALDSLHLKDAKGQSAYALELPAGFDLWNVLCTQAGHPALDLDTWHVGDPDTKESQMRALDFIHEIFQGLSVTAPPPKGAEVAGRAFAQQRASLLVGPSELAATLPKFRYDFTLLPRDMESASLARVNGWAVTAKSTEPEAAGDLARYFAARTLHAGWTSVLPSQAEETRKALCHEALDHAVVPRMNAKTTRLAGFIDQQIDQLARDNHMTSAVIFSRIQSQLQGQSEARAAAPTAAGITVASPAPKVEPAAQLRGL